jgi:hypothetical protein
MFTLSKRSRWMLWVMQILHCIVSFKTQFETWWWPSARNETCCLSNIYIYILHHLISCVFDSTTYTILLNTALFIYIVCACDLYVLDKNFINLRVWLFTYKYDSVLNYAARHEGMCGTEGIASLILTLHTWRRWIISLTPCYIFPRGKTPCIRATGVKFLSDAGISSFLSHLN